MGRRVRPILMATLATILAMVPMALELGETNEVMADIGGKSPERAKGPLPKHRRSRSLRRKPSLPENEKAGRPTEDGPPSFQSAACSLPSSPRRALPCRPRWGRRVS